MARQTLVIGYGSIGSYIMRRFANLGCARPPTVVARLITPADTLSPGGVKNGQALSFRASYAQYCGTKGVLDADELTGGLVFLLSGHAPQLGRTS